MVQLCAFIKELRTSLKLNPHFQKNNHNNNRNNNGNVANDIQSIQTKPLNKRVMIV